MVQLPIHRLPEYVALRARIPRVGYSGVGDRMRSTALISVGLCALLIQWLLPAPRAEAARYVAACAVPGVAQCRIVCSSNRVAVACYATIRNGRCFKRCYRGR